MDETKGQREEPTQESASGEGRGWRVTEEELEKFMQMVLDGRYSV